jgi:hypothetical protein
MNKHQRDLLAALKAQNAVDVANQVVEMAIDLTGQPYFGGAHDQTLQAVQAFAERAFAEGEKTMAVHLPDGGISRLILDVSNGQFQMTLDRPHTRLMVHVKWKLKGYSGEWFSIT